MTERSSRPSSLLYGPVAISDPSLGCPVTVVAGRVRPVRENDANARFASGWGATFAEAAMKCCFEADETHFAQVIPHQDITRAAAADIAGRHIEPPDILLFGDEQYDSRSSIEQQADGDHIVPARWQRTRPLDWIRSYSSLGGEDAWLPAGLCFLGYPNAVEDGLPPADSNGLAVGENLKDAATRAFFETVERDAAAIWWYNQLPLPQIDLQSLDDEIVQQYADWSRAQNRQLRLLKLTLDLPVPVIVAISSHRGGGAVALGCAAAESWSKAARRAVGELAQCEANLALLVDRSKRHGASGFSGAAQYLHQWHLESDIRNSPHLSGGALISELPQTTEISWNSCLQMCRDRNLEIFVVDLTQDYEHALVRVFVPGLRSTKPRFGGGRLYEVPIEMELVQRHPRTIHKNPFPF